MTEEENYQDSKDYTFKDLELSLQAKIEQFKKLQLQIKREKEYTASLRFKINNYLKHPSTDGTEARHKAREELRNG